MFGQGDRRPPPPPYTATTASPAAFASWLNSQADVAGLGPQHPVAAAAASSAAVAAFDPVPAHRDQRVQQQQHQQQQQQQHQQQQQLFRRPALNWPIGLSDYGASSSWSQSYGQLIVPSAQFDRRNAPGYQQHGQYQHHLQNRQDQDAVSGRDSHHRGHPVPVPPTGNVSWAACLTCGGATYYTGSSPLLSSTSPEDAHVLEVEYNRRRYRQHMQNNLNLALDAMSQGRMTFLQALVHYGLPRAVLRNKAFRLLQPRLHQNQITLELTNLWTAMADSEKPKPRGRGAYRKYDQKALWEAAAAVLRGDMSVHHAGFHYGVPSSTIGNFVRETRRRQRGDGWSRPQGSADQQVAAQPFWQPRQQSYEPAGYYAVYPQ